MSNSASAQPVVILLVEDSESDVYLAEETFRSHKVRNRLHVAWNGEEAMAFLRREGRYADAPRPDVILLDLNLPGKDGREVLAEIKSDPSLKLIPVVVVTTSADEADVLKAYGLHANCYITKPIDLAQFTRVVQAIDEFWFSIVRLPLGERHEY